MGFGRFVGVEDSRGKGFRLGCSPLYHQSLIGMLIGGTIIPIGSIRGKIPRFRVYKDLWF